MESTKLTLKIIESYGFPVKTTRPDWDDIFKEYKLPNGLKLTTLTFCNNEPCEADSLEGLDGYIFISTKEELDELLSKSFEDICKDIHEKDKSFDLAIVYAAFLEFGH